MQFLCFKESENSLAEWVCPEAVVKVVGRGCGCLKVWLGLKIQFQCDSLKGQVPCFADPSLRCTVASPWRGHWLPPEWVTPGRARQRAQGFLCPSPGSHTPMATTLSFTQAQREGNARGHECRQRRRTGGCLWRLVTTVQDNHYNATNNHRQGTGEIKTLT